MSSRKKTTAAKAAQASAVQRQQKPKEQQALQLVSFGRRMAPGPMVSLPKSFYPNGTEFFGDGSVKINFLRRGKLEPRVTAWKMHPVKTEKHSSSGLQPKAVLGNQMGRDSVVYPGYSAEAPAVGLSDCAALYMKALANPFGSFPSLPCVPAAPPVQSQKWRTVTRFTVTTGTTGWGWVMICPYRPGNDSGKYFFTGAAYAIAKSAGPNSASLGVTTLAATGLPYNNQAFSDGLQARLVALGVRLRNISQALNVGGTVAVGQVDDDTDINANMTGTAFEALPDTVILPQALQPGADWIVLPWRPMSELGTEFHGGAAEPVITNATMLVSITAPAAGTPNTYEVEVVEYWEFSGATKFGVAPPGTTLTDADMTGYERVLTAAQRIPLSADQKDWNLQMAHGIVDAVAHSDSVAKTAEAIMGVPGLVAKAIGPMMKTILTFLAL